MQPCFLAHQHHEIRVNPNARQGLQFSKVVDADTICSRVAMNPAVIGLHKSQRDPELWGEHDPADVETHELDMLKIGAADRGSGRIDPENTPSCLSNKQVGPGWFLR
eukprot:3620867-Amphidinium_carterae.1